jgi:hypothetical protein
MSYRVVRRIVLVCLYVHIALGISIMHIIDHSGVQNLQNTIIIIVINRLKIHRAQDY